VSDCPVCGKVGVDQAATRCPQCHADLECFALLDALQEAAPAPAPQADFQEVKQTIGSPREAVSRGAAGRGRRYDWPVLAAVAGLAALIVVMQLLTLDRRSAAPPAQTPQPVATAAAVEAVAGGIERLAGRLGAIEGRLDALASEQERATHDFHSKEAAAPAEKPPELVLHHHLRRGETLWSVAERYYGRGQLYPVLIAHNPGLGIYHRGAGTLRIFADPNEAAEMYRRITPPGGEGRLFRYRVEPNDDWRELARRFLGRPSRAAELVALNPESDLTPGEQVLIALE
jgi:hypothetical protein